MSGDSPLDEMADGTGNAKPHWRSLLSTMFALGHETLAQRATLLDQAFAEEGITAILPGERAVNWRCDPIPLLISAPEFAARLDEMTGELRFRELRGAFLTLAAERVPDLEAGAFLLSRFVRPNADPGVYRLWLDRVALAVSDGIPDDASTAEAVKRLSAHLFQSMGFAGNETNYYDPDNSCLSRVIDTRRGIPVTLSILYLLVAKRLKLPVYGVGTPGHFLLGFREGGDAHFLDAFRHGRMLEASAVRRMLVRNGYEFRPEYLKPSGPREILARMMRNLLSIYQKTGAAGRAEKLSVLVEIIVTGRVPVDDE